MMERLDASYAADLFQEARSGDQDAVLRLTDYLRAHTMDSMAVQSIITTTLKGNSSVLQADPAGESFRFRTAPRISTYGEAPASRVPATDEYGPFTEFWSRVATDKGLGIGDVVEVQHGGNVKWAEPTNAHPTKRKVPVGVVTQKNGRDVLVRQTGRCFVRLDRGTWDNEGSDEIWLSDTTDGRGSPTMPRTARNGITLLGYRAGPVRNGVAPAILLPAQITATWKRVWEYDADNYIDLEYLAHRGGFHRMTFVCGGSCVAILDKDTFWLSGTLHHSPYAADINDTPTDSRLGEVEYTSTSSLDASVGAITFQVPHSGTGTYTRIAELNENGDLRIGGIATGGYPDSAANSAAFSGASYETNSDKIEFTLDGVQTFMRFRRKGAGTTPVNATFEVDDVTTGVLPG